MNKLSELKDGSTFFYNDLARGCVATAVKVGPSKNSTMLIGEFDVITNFGPIKLPSCTEVYPTKDLANRDLKKFLQDKVTLIKNKIIDLEEELKIYEDSLVKVASNESD